MSDERFEILSELYLAGNISDQESLELEAMLKGSRVYQLAFANNLTFDVALQEVIDAEYAVAQEIERNGPLKQFSAKKKFNSKRFEPVSHSIFTIQKAILMAALILISIGGIYLFNGQASKSAVISLSQIENVGDFVVTRDQKQLELDQDLELRTGDVIQTGKLGFSRLLTKDNSEIYIDQNTKLLLTQDGIRIIEGNIYAQVQKSDGDFLKNYYVGDLGKIKILGTIFEAGAFNRDTFLKVAEGKVRYTYNGQESVVNAGGYIYSNQTHGLGQVREIEKISDVGLWSKYLKIYKKYDVVMMDSFDGARLREDWHVEKNGEASVKIENENKTLVELQVAGKNSNIVFSLKPLNILDADIAFAFHTLKPIGKGHYEFGWELISDGKTANYSGFSVKSIGKDKGYFLHEIFGNPENPKKGPLMKSTDTPDINADAFLRRLSAAEKMEAKSNDAKFKYEENSWLPNIELNHLVSKNIEVRFHLKSLSDQTDVKWHLDGIVILKNEEKAEVKKVIQIIAPRSKGEKSKD